MESSNSVRSPSCPRSQDSTPNSIRSLSRTQKEPSCNAAATSPPLTSFLNDRHSASSVQESAYLRQTWLLRMLRLIQSVLSIGVAAAALGCAGSALQTYNSTHLERSWFLSLWPTDLDLKPTISILAPAGVAILVSLVYLVVAAIPSVCLSMTVRTVLTLKPRSHTTLLNMVYICATATSFVAILFTVVYSPVLVYEVDPNNRESLQSFTCKFYRGANTFTKVASKLQIPVYNAIKYPAGFKRICMETEAALGLMVGLLGLQVAGLAVAGTGIWLEKKINNARQARHQEKWESASQGNEPVTLARSLATSRL